MLQSGSVTRRSPSGLRHYDRLMAEFLRQSAHPERVGAHLEDQSHGVLALQNRSQSVGRQPDLPLVAYLPVGTQATEASAFVAKIHTHHNFGSCRMHYGQSPFWAT